MTMTNERTTMNLFGLSPTMFQAPPDDVFGCIGFIAHSDGSIEPLAAVDMEQMLDELDPFYSLPCGPEIVAGYGVHAAESLPDGW
jgi:hypothetical protein